MHPVIKFAAAFAVALPLAAIAQTSPNVKPADQPRTPLEQQQTTQNGQATQYGGPGTDAGSSPTTSKGSMAPMKHKAMKDKTDSTKPGDVPSYPAPAKDGTPTK